MVERVTVTSYKIMAVALGHGKRMVRGTQLITNATQAGGYLTCSIKLGSNTFGHDIT